MPNFIQINIEQKFSFIEKIGTGRYGPVHLCKDVNTRQLRVVKCSSHSSIADMHAFELEKQIAMKMQHPNICKLIEFCEDRQHYYLVFEYCNGTELMDLLEEQ